MMKVKCILILIFQNINSADLKGLTTIKTTYKEWKHAKSEFDQLFSDSVVKNDQEVRQTCASSFEEAHGSPTRCSLRPGLAWVKHPHNVGEGREGHISHWSPVQVEATRCFGQCHEVHHDVDNLDKHHRKEMWMPACKAKVKKKRKVPVKVTWYNGTHLEQFCEFWTVTDHTECSCTECHTSKDNCRKVPGQ
eukprot:GFUD01025251.1.p1 GENE.GFUD01025251.1~~GFUD01025251.1.p1  ORF type:complete len:192 (+),score=51.25 GFUD01025251.1:119-694(+)